MDINKLGTLNWVYDLLINENYYIYLFLFTRNKGFFLKLKEYYFNLSFFLCYFFLLYIILNLFLYLKLFKSASSYNKYMNKKLSIFLPREVFYPKTLCLLKDLSCFHPPHIFENKDTNSGLDTHVRVLTTHNLPNPPFGILEDWFKNK